MTNKTVYPLSNELSTYVRRDKPENPRGYCMQAFRKNSISPSPDSELTDLIATSSQYMSDSDLARFLRAQKRFDGTITMMETGQKMEHYSLKESLRQLPDYMAAAESAGLTYGQANYLLLHKLNCERGNTSGDDSIGIYLVAKALKQAAASGADIPGNYAKFKEFIDVTSKYYIDDGSLYAFAIATRMGLSIEQSTRMILKLPEADGLWSQYVIGHFHRALNTLNIAKVDPELVVEVFDMLGGKRPYFQGSNYQTFAELITFGVPTSGKSPNDVLKMFSEYAKRRSGKKVPLLESVAKQLTREEKELQVISRTNRDGYFIDLGESGLEHAALPYKTKRALNDGIRDLEKMAVANPYKRWEEAGEGSWVYDPKTNMWYSFGGKVELALGKVRHNFIPHDISALSDNPVLFHVHPQYFEVMIAPPRDALAHPQFRDDITKFLTATPSSADYGAVAEFLKDSRREVSTRSFIAHARGITEFIYPNNIAQLEEMKEKSRDIRDQALLQFNVDELIVNRFASNRKLDLVQRLVQDLDERLPEGFNIILHPVGTDF